MSLGNNIYNLRKEKGFSQEDLANVCNVSRQTVSKWESDEVLPDTKNLLELSKVFNKTIDELLNNEIVSDKPDVFDKSVHLVKKHWAKIGYKFMVSGVVFIIFSFVVRVIFSSFFHTQENMINGFGMGHLMMGQVHLGNNMFNIFSNFILIIGLISLIIGIVLAVYDYKKNHVKE